MANLKNLIVQGISRFIGDIIGKSFIKSGGTASLALMANGSVLAVDTSKTANTIVKRDGSGYIRSNIYSEDLRYNLSSINSSGGTVSISTADIVVVTLTGNVTNVSLPASLPQGTGGSILVIFTSTAQRTVTIQNSSTLKCPNNSNITLTVPANGFVEVDFLYDGNSHYYVRGV